MTTDDQYVPDEEQVRAWCREGVGDYPDVMDEWLDRFLARVRRDAAREALDGLADAEHRATRAEAQSAIRGRAVAICQRRAREAEAERDWNWRSSRHSKIERIRAIARADRAEAEARAQRRRADDMEDNALRAQTNLRAAEERVDEWARDHLAAQEPTDAECIAFWHAFEDAADETNIENIRAALSAARAVRNGASHE